jgi:Uncharacterised protein family UPF0547
MDGFFITWIVVGGVVGITAYNVANNRGRGDQAIGWFVGCAFLPLAILILLSLPPLARPGGTIKTCPQCAETVKAAAKVCRFCRYEFPSEASPIVQVKEYAPTGPLPEGYQGSYKGFPYRIEGGRVEVLTKAGPRTYATWQEFTKSRRYFC